MSKKYTPEDIGDLGLYGDQEQEALQEFCDIVNESDDFLGSKISAWAKKYESAGAGDTASRESQVDVLVMIVRNNQGELNTP